jgi:hypothetical protein
MNAHVFRHSFLHPFVRPVDHDIDAALSATPLLYLDTTETVKLSCWHDVQVQRIIRPLGEMMKFSIANSPTESNFKEVLEKMLRVDRK